ncbi:hypothetical protein M0651_06490 [Paenibacillus sp. MBLB2552]|uniref:Uncharacterized protein n=1 Tax=Paenibacillus mellifer TaxID=2937794 RepID=A0A9X1XWZ6_9BACL|nr:hypothetical protein [Paenibacillus mellifer]MCK8486822.1 hypothetical protein [Paenibacillus mellifer]
MINHVKSLVWLLFSVSTFLAATLYTLEIGKDQNGSYDVMAIQLHGVGRSVYAHEGKDSVRVTAGNSGDDELLELTSEIYTGNEILHRLPDWIELGVTIEVEGEILNATLLGPLEDELEQSRKRALSVLELREEYTSERVYNSTGKEIRVIFSRK